MSSSLVLANIFGGWGFVEMALLMTVGVLIFGKRLPEVGRNLGRSIVEFKKGINGAGETAVEAATVEQTPKYIGAQVGSAQTVALALPSNPATEELVRKQELELQRLNDEIRQLREQAAHKSANQA